MISELKRDIQHSFYVFEEQTERLLRDVPEDVRNELLTEYDLFRAAVWAMLDEKTGRE